MINKLTAKQESLLKQQYQQGLDIGRSIKPLNHEKVEDVITKLYKAVGKDKLTFLFFSSPLMCELVISALEQSKNQLRSQLESQLRSQLWSQLWSQLESQLESQLGSQLRSQLWSQLRSQLWSQLGRIDWQLELQLRSQLGSQLISYYFAGQNWCAWECFYDFGRKIGVKYTKEQNQLLDLWIEQSKECYWWFPFEEVVFISERPTKLNLDQQGRLHSETEPAIEFADSWGLYYWHGIYIPDQWITNKDQIDIRKELNNPNIELRRCVAEIVGWNKILATLNCQEIQQDSFGVLYRVDLPNAPGSVFVKVKCATGREFAIPVTPNTKTAREAVAKSYGFSEAEQYNPEIRT